MTTPVHTVEAIQAAAGSHIIVQQRGRRNNFKCDLARLANSNLSARGYTDDEKFSHLAEARRALIDAGYDVAFKFQQRNQQGEWTPWPHLWVNISAAAVAPETEARLKTLEDQNAALLARLDEFLSASSEGSSIETVPDTNAPIEDSSESDEDIF